MSRLVCIAMKVASDEEMLDQWPARGLPQKQTALAT
jgi:hypothetical protein